jgi:hypothetical protein
MADFGDHQGRDAGFAKTGFGVGLELKLPLGPRGLFCALDGSFLFNGFDVDAFVRNAGGMAEDGEATWGWLNLPLLAGIRYDVKVSPGAEMYGVVLSGLDISRTPDVEWTGQIFDGYAWHSARTRQEGDFASSLAFGVGGGVVLRDDVDISFRYLDVSSPKFDTKSEVTLDSGTEVRPITYEQPISVFLVSVGLKF